MTKIHDDPTCPCHEWNAESPATQSGDAGFLVPEAKNVPTGQEMPRIDPYEYLRTFKYAPPDAESAQPVDEAGVTAPTFEQEWQSAPRAMTAYVEQSIAEYWFLRGGQAREVELIATMNQDLREITRIAGARIDLAQRKGEQS